MLDHLLFAGAGYFLMVSQSDNAIIRVTLNTISHQVYATDEGAISDEVTITV